MMRAAVCDSDGAVVNLIKEVLEHTSGIDRCDGYTGLSFLTEALETGEEYQLIILAIEWDGKAEGLETAARIQAMSADVRIIYMTEYPLKYVQQIFLQPTDLSGFLIKPVNGEILQRYIRNILTGKEEGRMDSLMVKNKRGIFSVRFGEILYMESESHVITIQTKTDKHSCYGRLEKLLEQLPESFIQCHKSYVVNMKEIRQIEKNCIQMENGLVIPISKSRYSDTKNRYIHYMEAFIRQA